MKPKHNYRRSSLLTPLSVERRRNETPFQRIAKKDENRPISGKIILFPNPNTINNFMMAIDYHMRSSLVMLCRPLRHLARERR